MKSNELIQFESAIGFELDLKTRRNESVDLRDMFIMLNVKKSDTFGDTMKLINRERTSIYALRKRFKLRYELYPDYKTKFNDLKIKLTGNWSYFLNLKL